MNPEASRTSLHFARGDPPTPPRHVRVFTLRREQRGIPPDAARVRRRPGILRREDHSSGAPSRHPSCHRPHHRVPRFRQEQGGEGHRGVRGVGSRPTRVGARGEGRRIERHARVRQSRAGGVAHAVGLPHHRRQDPRFVCHGEFYFNFRMGNFIDIVFFYSSSSTKSWTSRSSTKPPSRSSRSKLSTSSRTTWSSSSRRPAWRCSSTASGEFNLISISHERLDRRRVLFNSRYRESRRRTSTNGSKV